MAISLTCRDMAVEIANETGETVHVVLYKRSLLRPAEPPVAWIIVSPPSRGRALFTVSADYRVFVRYTSSPEGPWQPVNQTNALSLRRTNDSLSVRGIYQGRLAWGALLARNARQVGLGKLRIENELEAGVWCHVQLGERDVHLPRILPPHGVLIEALDSPFFLAVVSAPARVGVPLAEDELRATEVELSAIEGGAFTVRGTPFRGYRLTRGAPDRTEATPSKKAAVKRALEKKLKPPARPKVDVKKKEPANRRAGQAATVGPSVQIEAPGEKAEVRNPTAVEPAAGPSEGGATRPKRAAAARTPAKTTTSRARPKADGKKREPAKRTAKQRSSRGKLPEDRASSAKKI